MCELKPKSDVRMGKHNHKIELSGNENPSISRVLNLLMSSNDKIRLGLVDEN